MGESTVIKVKRELLRVSRGDEPADILLKNAQIINVFTGTVENNSVAIFRDKIAGVGSYRAKRTIDLKGHFLSPGFIDSHIHLESTMLTPPEFTKAVLPKGTTSVIIDPHEVANVLGSQGIDYILDSSRLLPLSFYLMLPSCVPATKMETSGAKLTREDLKPFLKERRVLGLAEVMNYPDAISGNNNLLSKIEMVKGMRIDGHAPGLRGKALSAYIAAGITSDHESTVLGEAEEKLRRGMFIMIREGTTEKNLRTLLPLVREKNFRRFMFVSDDKHPSDLLKDGHLDGILRKAVRMGLSPVIAIQLVTITPSEYFGLRGIGAIAPGYKADLVVLKDLKKFDISLVFKDGKLVVKNRRILPCRGFPMSKRISRNKLSITNSMHVNWNKIREIRVRVRTRKKPHIKVITISPNQIVTQKALATAKIQNGCAVSNPQDDILKAVVIERHKKTGNRGIAFVKGFGLRKGAIASSVAHDAHNIVSVGVDDADILLSARKVAEMKGGLTVVADGRILASLPLPIAGLLSERPLNVVARSMEKLIEAARRLGCNLPDPFMTLSFLALPVIPELRLTDKGLIDVHKFKLESVFC